MLLVPETLKGYREQMSAALAAGKTEEAAAASVRLSTGRCAELLTEAPRPHIFPTLEKMKRDRAGRILTDMSPDLVASLLNDLSDTEAFGWMQEIAVDRAADIYALFPEERQKAYLCQLNKEDAVEIRELSSHKAGSVGAVMTTNFLAIREDTTIGETREAIREAPSHTETRNYIYILDKDDKPVGVLSLRDILRQDRASVVKDVMGKNLIVVEVDTEATYAAEMLRNRGYLALPVIEESGRLVGILEMDVAISILAQNVADQFVTMGGASTEESFYTPPMGSVRMRLPWMAANIFLNLGAVFVISSFEDTIAQVALLAVFLPMITDMGGNVGIQALSVAIRSIALGEVRLQEFWKATRKELTIGLVNGVALGCLFALVAYVIKGNGWLGLVAGTALGVNVLMAGVIGGTLPFLIKRLGKDPAMMTGPVLTTITDITGVTIYLGLSTLFLTQILG
ncbi:MAG: magnesium transporter [Opitutales bacterium]|nr:magnesium transporter [Opitutales bacterium]